MKDATLKNESLEKWQVHFLSYILGIEQNFLNEATSMNELPVRSCADIYKRGYKARLVESLGETYSATWWVLGDDDYLKLAEEFVASTPSRSFDLSDYGKEFPDFLKSSVVVSEIPFISELSRFEWVFKILFHSADVPNKENFLSRLSQNPEMKLRLLPSTILWRSNFSIYEIWKQRDGDIAALNDIDLELPEFILCRKLEGKVRMNYLEESELRLLQQFETPRSIDEAVASYQNLYGELTPESVQSLFSRIGVLGVLEGAI
ncbi:MAG: hypothetical protein A2622_09580 [Bdellovibrionales bacterium RIFCSPHIGHO2_01_FULL_40_29]|nr:MAG: hypothetical protein A2622_09580 [Bdellovibrionales bacterium RIFCSPHIGHO2_01_FULL_40_29]OFZ33528.1 MAG: hypothetical protein A3D17_00040 [Bdellovibrionales bacterium RIFCSPHIGHO2_02_FULL_40_15]